MAEPSLEMMIGILGILKAGGAYLPIAHDYPAERVKYILRTAGYTYTFIKDYTLLGSLDFDGEMIDLEDKRIYSLKVYIPNQ